jgi:hypothetical protein
MGLASTLLSALAYPKAANFNHQDEPAFRALVAWLENVKVPATKPSVPLHQHKRDPQQARTAE